LRIYLQSNGCRYMEVRRDVFQAIADPTRRAIITLLAAQALTPGAIAANFNATRQTISKHIQILTECELLKYELSGREIYYRLNFPKMKEIADFIEPFRAMWDNKMNNLDEVLEQLKNQ
jgi:DNA-binding transcriptional ArsR family regulator